MSEEQNSRSEDMRSAGETPPALAPLSELDPTVLLELRQLVLTAGTITGLTLGHPYIQRYLDALDIIDRAIPGQVTPDPSPADVGCLIMPTRVCPRSLPKGCMGGCYRYEKDEDEPGVREAWERHWAITDAREGS